MNNSNKLGASIGKANQPAPQEKFFQQFIALPPALQGAPWQIIGIDQSGISPRDYFAREAMSMLFALDFDREAENFPAIARDAYRMADAMMEARKPPFNNSQFHEDHMTPHKGQSKP